MSFEAFESRVGVIAARHPGMPIQAVMLVRTVLFLQRHLDDELTDFWAEHGLSPSAWSVLMMLYSTPDHAISPSCASQAVSQSRAHVTRLSDELVQAGWVERVPSVEDRRSINLHLTAGGQARIQELLPLAGQLYERLVAGLTPQAQATLADSLRGWIGALEAPAQNENTRK